MSSFDRGVNIEDFDWYKELIELAGVDVEACREVIGAIPSNVLEEIDRKNLLEIVKRCYDSKEVAGADLKIGSERWVVSEILERVVLLVEDELFTYYCHPSQRCHLSDFQLFVLSLRCKKEEQVRKKDFFDKHPGLKLC
jgi:inorganic pyrophosphatase/exopolyphosphatase